MKPNAIPNVTELPPTLAVTSPATHAAGNGAPSTPNVIAGTVFGSAEKRLEAEVAADIAECNRIIGEDDFFDTQEQAIRKRLPPAYKMCRRAFTDPAYGVQLAKQMLAENGGTYKPSGKKPWILAAHKCLRPKNERAVKQTYEATYYFRHALIDDVPVEQFGAWIENRNMKASRDYVREREQSRKGGETKKAAYPNLAKARTLKDDVDVQQIMKVSKDTVEAELATLFAAREASSIAANKA